MTISSSLHKNRYQTILQALRQDPSKVHTELPFDDRYLICKTPTSISVPKIATQNKNRLVIWGSASLLYMLQTSEELIGLDYEDLSFEPNDVDIFYPYYPPGDYYLNNYLEHSSLDHGVPGPNITNIRSNNKRIQLIHRRPRFLLRDLLTIRNSSSILEDSTIIDSHIAILEHELFQSFKPDTLLWAKTLMNTADLNTCRVALVKDNQENYIVIHPNAFTDLLNKQISFTPEQMKLCHALYNIGILNYNSDNRRSIRDICKPLITSVHRVKKYSDYLKFSIESDTYSTCVLILRLAQLLGFSSVDDTIYKYRNNHDDYDYTNLPFCVSDKLVEYFGVV